MLHVNPITTRLYSHPENLVDFVADCIQDAISDGLILAITSKLFSLAENRVVKKEHRSKAQLVKQQCDTYLAEAAYGCHLTIKEGLLIPSAGIDESNSPQDDYLLFPKNPFDSCQLMHQALCQRFKLQNFGVLMTDSTTRPLRRGVGGVALAYYGFRGVKDMIGQKDLYGRPLKMTQVNLADNLAAAATLCMGEGAESSPLALVQYPAEFNDLPDNNEIQISKEDDIYSSLF